jgi:hypothetical protein
MKKQTFYRDNALVEFTPGTGSGTGTVMKQGKKKNLGFNVQRQPIAKAIMPRADAAQKLELGAVPRQKIAKAIAPRQTAEQMAGIFPRKKFAQPKR